MEFEWSEVKAAANFAKHRVHFDFATRAFLDPVGVDLDASRASDGEPRRKRLGVIEGHLYAVVYTVRGGRCRLISARKRNPTEQRLYGNG
jgi:uncharacterized DUF497 family protein